ncbi:MAG: hypothetical protein JKY48_04475 [Flavobacteriales bacterium]|nr:hypothetical protein [Flavobacteriales bacterium]
MKKKIYQKIVLASLVIFSIGCNVVELDEPGVPTNSKGDEITEVSNGDVHANDSISFRTLISDSTSKIWDASFFTILGISQTCRFDDVMMFFHDGTYQYSSGPEFCDDFEDIQRSRTGSWEIGYMNRTITFDKGNSNEYQAEVIGLSEDELRLKGSYLGMEIRGLYSKN